MSNRSKAVIALLLATLFGSTAGAAVKILLITHDPFAVAFFRFGLAALIIIPWFIFSKRPRNLFHTIKEILPIAALSTINIALFFVALTKTTANAAAIIYAATPILTAILSPFLIGEHVSVKKIAGIILGLIGVLFILVLPSIEKTHVLVGDVGGNILVFFAACSWALYTIGSRYLTVQKHHDPLTISAISISLTALVTLVISASTTGLHMSTLVGSPTRILLVIHLALFVTIGMYMLYQYAIKHLSATTASFSNYLGPVFSFAINALVLGEQMTLGFVVGSILVFAGTFLASSSRIGAAFQSLRKRGT